MDITFNYEGMKETRDFIGYNFLAISTNGANRLTAYIAKIKGRKIYGFYDYQLGEYVEERI
jgi:hypothetical protein